jgi:hypothetical protein
MSTILVDNLTGKTSAGDITVTSEGGAATQSLQQGLCKVFFQTDTLISYTTIGNTNDSLNISSFTDDQTGELHFAFSSNMSQKGFSTLANASDSSIDDTVTTNHDNISTSGSEVIIFDTARKDQPVSCAIFGDLA